MKKCAYAPVVLAASLACLAASPAGAALKTPRVSPNATLTQTVGVTDVTLTYSRPGVKGRPIWGSLVPYGAPWRTGANEATTVSFTDDVTINGRPLAAGKYSLFTLPAQDGWTVIFSRQKELWGAFAYDSTQDALRVPVKAEAAEPVEWMEFEFDSLTAYSARLSVRWEKLRVPFTIGVNTDALVLAQARKALQDAKADDWATPFQAARYSFDNNLANLSEAAGWLELSLKAKETFQNLGLKARMQAKAGNKSGAIETAEKAVQMEKTRTLGKGEERGDTRPLEKLIGEWKGK